MSIVKNPELEWDGQTTHGEGDRPIEGPHDWRLAVERIPGEPSPFIYHKDKGFNIDANHIRAQVSWAQDVTLPAGEQYVIVHCLSHVTWGDDEFTVGWRVELETQNQIYRSDDLWLSRQKGDQSFAVRFDVPAPTPATLRIIYQTRWADTNGSIDLQKVDIQPQSWGLPVRDTVTMGTGAATRVTPPGAAEQPTEVAAVGAVTAMADNSPTVTVERVHEANPAMAVAFANLSAAMNDCVQLTQSNTDSATIARCFQQIAAALVKSAEQLES